MSMDSICTKAQNTSSRSSRFGRRSSHHARTEVLLSGLLLVFGGALTPPLIAQTFNRIPAISFVKPYAGANPLPQVITVSTSTPVNFSITATSTSGGNWLTVPSSGCCYSTPHVFTVAAAPEASLNAGTYTGRVVIAQNGGGATQTIPVTLSIERPIVPFFDNLPGQLSFSLPTGGVDPPKQIFQIRNAGVGTLNWTSSVTTSDGGKWFTLSTASGTGASNVAVAVNVAALPGAGQIAGTYTGQIALHTAASSVTIPVSVTVGDSVFRQVNPLSFNKTFADTQDPLPQTISITSTDADFNFGVSSYTANGGNWLSVSAANCCFGTPTNTTVSVTPAPSLPAGIYTGEIVVYENGSAMAMTIPVTLTIEGTPLSAPFFDSLPGQLSFFLQTNAAAPPPQPVPIRNAGAGTLAWTAATSTSDGGAWIALSASSGTAPSNLTARVVPSFLPGGGQLAGTYIGQILLQSSSGSVTVPVSVTVGDSVFRQVNPLSFNKAFADTQDPLPQTVSITSTDAAFNFGVKQYTASGGDWLSVSAAGCCFGTPTDITVSVTPAASLPAGIYTGEIVVYENGSAMAMTIPVTLTIEGTPRNAPFFDALPGQLSFSLQTDAAAPPAQPVPIRNAGSGALLWSAAASTSDGGDWIALSASSGAAPAALKVSIKKASLPGGGDVAGTYVGELVLQSSSGSVTIPVSVTVGDSVFRQVNDLNFEKLYADSQNPLPQTISIASTNDAFNFGVSSYTASGGNWLNVNASGCCYSTPHSIIVSVAPAASLAPGIYSGQVVVYQNGSAMALTLPVYLTITRRTSPVLDDLPGQASFFVQPSVAANPAPESIWIRNAGSGTLNWTASATTSDAGRWITLSATNGTAPAKLAVGVSLSALPGGGHVSGTYTGQVVVASPTGSETIPVSVVVDEDVFKPVPAVIFDKPNGSGTPPSHTITINTLGAAFNFGVSVYNGRGGNWLNVNANGCCYGTPTSITLSVNPSVNLVDGVYASEVVIYQNGLPNAMTIPVYYIVGPAPTRTALNSSRNPSTQGEAVVLTATVNGFASNISGEVVFKEGTSTLASVPLTAGVAHYTTAKLPVGTGSLTVVYNGNGVSASSTSPVLSQKVLAKPAH